MAKYYAANAIKIAKKEVGYLEKKSNAYLNYKKKNAGSANYTKYGVVTGTNGDFWCASFVCWVIYILCGKSISEAKRILCGVFSAACETLRNGFVKAGRYDKTPKKGDLIFFSGSRHSGANHIGIVAKVEDGYVYTYEGNTSGSIDNSDDVTDNGGAVCYKKYAKSNSRIMGYGHPKYDKKPAVTTKLVGKLYKKCNTQSGFYKRVLKGTKVVFKEDKGNGWSKVAIGGDIGYMKNSCINKSGLSTYKKATVTVKAPMRKKNKKGSKVLCYIPAGTEVTKVGAGKYWINIKYNGMDGFVFHTKIK